MEGERDQRNIKRGRFAWFLSLGCVLVGAISLLLAVGSLVMTVMGPLGAIVGERAHREEQADRANKHAT